MLQAMGKDTRRAPEPDEPLELPELDGGDEREGLEDSGEIALPLPDAGDPSLGDGASDELPLDVGLPWSMLDEPSVLGDDAEGFADAPATLGLSVQEPGESMLERDQGELGTMGEDEALGIEPLPAEGDRSDADGLEDGGGERFDPSELPVLDQGDDGEIDVGIELELEPVPTDATEVADDDDVLGPRG
jgi:hypothetical protein